MYPELQSWRGRRGFTLVEILVVVVIVGIVMSLALLSFGLVGNDREVQTEVQRFMALVQVAQDDALMQGREFGVELLHSGYRFVEYDPDAAQWADILGDDTLRLRSLPEGLEFDLYLEDKRVLLDDDAANIEDVTENQNTLVTRTYAPHLLIYSSGDTTPFDLVLHRPIDDLRIEIRGDALGGVEIVDPDAEEQ